MADHNRQLIEIFSRPLPDDELAETTRKLCSVYLNGVWQTISAKQMDIKLQSGGLNNSLFVVKLAPNVKRIGDEPQTVILRIYRNVTCEGELIQTAISLALAERSLGPALLGVFPGGRIDEFIPSRIVTNKEFLNINVAQRLARIIANIHSLELPISKKPILVDIIQKMLDELKKSFRWISKQKMPATIVKPEVTVNEISLKLLEDELQIAKDCMEKSGSPVVFCNNDIHVRI